MAGLTQADEIQGDMVPLVVTLAEAAGLEPTRMEALLGNKAANLARLAVAGFPVPAGVVVTPTAAADWERACARLGRAVAELGGGTGQRFAVRSSGTAEDLAGASFAGQYETVLDVGIDELPGAVRRVLDSAASARVSAYRRAHPEAAAAPAGDSSGAGAGMAVLIQVMVAADAAGVAFTANPLTGDREEVVITAVRGLGERLVAGQATGDQWIVRDGQARCTRAAEQAITGGQARQIATLARRVHAHFTSPQDLEWAISAGTARANGRLWLLQARPMTALPDPVAWTPPARGYWMRNLRLGEWLPEPMTPLFADWLLERVDHGELQATRDHLGGMLQFPHAAINGWYYLATPPLSPRTILAALLQGRGRLLRFLRYGVLGPSRDPVAADRHLLASSTRSAPPPASSCGRWRWWAARRGRWKAPWPASTASTWPRRPAPVSSGCSRGCPAPNPTCPPTRCRASTGPIPRLASWAGRHPGHRTATASWPPAARPSPPSSPRRSPAGRGCRSSSGRCWRSPSATSPSASSKHATLLSAGHCCAAARYGWARRSAQAA